MKFLLYILLAAGAVYGMSVVVPDNLQDRALAAIGLADFSAVETIQNTASRAKDTVSDALIPASPQERRAKRIDRLKTSLEDIRLAQERYSTNLSPQAQQETEKAIRQTESVVQELKKQNAQGDTSTAQTLIDAGTNVVKKITGEDEQTQDKQVCLSPEEYELRCVQ